MSHTANQKSGTIEVQEDNKIPLLMWSPQCSTRKRGHKKLYQFVLIVNHTTMKPTFYQLHDLLRMVDKIMIFKKHVPFLTNHEQKKISQGRQCSGRSNQNKRPSLRAERSHEGQSYCFTVTAIPRHGRHVSMFIKAERNGN